MSSNPSGAIHPIVFMFLWIVSSVGLQRLWPLELPGPPAVVLAGKIVLALGAGLMVWAAVAFSRHGTTTAHSEPTTALITDGPFRLSRNPIYLAMLLLFVGLALVYSNAWALVATILFVILVTRFTIGPEEDYLTREFGADYSRYRSSVRRWV